MVIFAVIHESPQGYAVTGGQDAVVNVFNLEKPRDDPDFSLLGHLDNVCALHVTPGGTIVSGSWDKSVKITQSTRIPFHFLQNG
jgi:phospholipase A-2-activating protein